MPLAVVLPLPHRRLRVGLRSALLLPATLGLAAVALAACTKAPNPSPPPSPVAVGNSSATSPATSSDTSTPITTASSSTSPASTTPTPTRTSTHTTSSAPVGPAACTTSQLKLAVLRGSGAAGHQFAYLDFTNVSATTCSLTGYPGVELLKGGAPLAKPAARSGKPINRVDLPANAVASALLTNNSTCNADNSDSVQVIVPNQTGKTVLPLRFRGCTMIIDPVVAGTGQN
ncbi:DUF4232 domain-containing protein [Jatrophihabitans telluris]|uniref:DUF4232 domain-containing protein n=1 Tax=Jatrophihabitans telluris TaxID=2038343 RepID=A0ABY4QZI8_9ACTN|nr:DUF4232 domain-containing protein [Jatrophihabitans telluris]UQX89096.1 DUF4232 domain-containing protein [Jatrophihabitans telluris]